MQSSIAEPNDDPGLELPGLGSSPVIRIITDEVKSKNPILVFLEEMKASASKLKGIQHKGWKEWGIGNALEGRGGYLV